MNAKLCWAGLILAPLLIGGCVERRFVITSDPPGAVVFDENNNFLGATPVDKPFTYYGKYRFTLVKDGYQTTVVEQDVKAPWYDVFGIDFVSENLLPIRFQDVHRIGGDSGVPMAPAQIPPPEPVLKAASDLRVFGRSIGVPLPAGEVR